MKNAKRKMRTWIKLIIFTLCISFENAGISQEFTLPAYIDDITSCDIDLDGDNDIICICQVLNYDEDSIFIFYNNGEGTFQRIGYHFPNSGFILCDCIDENESPDLITRLSYNVFYIPNNEIGEFGSPVTIDNNMGANMSVITDLNNDGLNEIIFSDNYEENWGIYENIDGLIFTKEIIQSGSSTTNPAVGLITDDSLPDIVLTYSAFDRSSVNVNHGNFNFTEVILEQTFIGEAFVMNIDDQGAADFVFVNYYTNTIPLYKYIGNDQFILQSNYYAAGIYTISSFLVSDFNQDGYDDFAITKGDWWNSSDSLYIYLNDQNWSFNLNQTLYIGELNWFKSLASDLNGDSFPDIFMKGCNGSNILTLLWNDGTGDFSFENPVFINDSDSITYQIEVFPNPFHGNVRIEILPRNNSQLSVSIYDIFGIKVKSITDIEASNSKQLIINWDGTDEEKTACPEGIYILTLRSNSDQISKKIIKY